MAGLPALPDVIGLVTPNHRTGAVNLAAVFAEAQPVGAGDPVTLGIDLVAVQGGGGSDQPAIAAVASVDGFDVAVAGEPRVGGSTPSFAVERGGSAVATEPYLGAAGHLVALRSGDLAYVHAHVESFTSGSEPDAHPIDFDAAFLTAGTHRLFLDFSVDDVVHTADFTLAVTDHGPATPTESHGGH